jgi:hypothetical protein
MLTWVHLRSISLQSLSEKSMRNIPYKSINQFGDDNVIPDTYMYDRSSDPLDHDVMGG